MKYLVLRDYINRDGELVRTGDYVDLIDDNFTKPLVEHQFVIDYSLCGAIKCIADGLSALVEKAAISLEKALKETRNKGGSDV